MPKAAIFDCDGLLLDTDRAWTIAADQLSLERRGTPLSPDERSLVAGLSVDQIAETLAPALAVDAAQLRPEFLALLVTHVRSHAVPRPGAEDLLDALAGRLPIAIVSNAPREVLDLALSTSGLPIDGVLVLSVEDVARPKPAPDPYVRACQLMGVRPDEAVAFEDSAPGVDSARKAGVSVVAIVGDETRELPADITARTLNDATIWRLLGLPRSPSEELRVLYEENAKAAAAFWEWRHRLLTVFFTAIAALSLSATWAYTHVHTTNATANHVITIIPLVAVDAIAIGCALLEQRNSRILSYTYMVGAAIEDEWLPVTHTAGFYSALRRSRRMYRNVLVGIFGTVALAALVTISVLAASTVGHHRVWIGVAVGISLVLADLLVVRMGWLDPQSDARRERSG